MIPIDYPTRPQAFSYSGDLIRSPTDGLSPFYTQPTRLEVSEEELHTGYFGSLVQGEETDSTIQNLHRQEASHERQGTDLVRDEAKEARGADAADPRSEGSIVQLRGQRM